MHVTGNPDLHNFSEIKDWAQGFCFLFLRLDGQSSADYWKVGLTNPSFLDLCIPLWIPSLSFSLVKGLPPNLLIQALSTQREAG